MQAHLTGSRPASWERLTPDTESPCMFREKQALTNERRWYGNIGARPAEAGRLNLSIAQQPHVRNLTEGKRRRRFAEHGIKCLIDAPRSRAPRSIVTSKSNGSSWHQYKPRIKNAAHSRTHQMAAPLDMIQTAICRIWHAFALARSSQPNLQAVDRSPNMRRSDTGQHLKLDR